MQLRRLALAAGIVAALAALGWFALRGASTPQTPALELPAPSQAARPKSESSTLEADSAAAREEKAAPPAVPATTTTADPESGDATLRARCIDEQGAPILGVRLMALGSEKPLTLSAVDGRIDAAIPIEQAEGLKARLELVDRFHVSCAFERVLRRGQECDLGDVVLKLGACIRGSVVDENGKPIAQAWVTSSKKSLLPRGQQNEPDARNAHSLADGSFLLEGVVPETNCVTAFAEKHATGERAGLELVAGRELAGIVITLRPEQAPDDSGLLVRVLQPSGEPLNGALVQAELHEGERTSISIGATDEQGQRHLDAGPAASADIVVSDEIYERYASAFALDVPVSRRTLEIRLEQGTPHALLVVDDHDAPVESYAVRILYEPEYHPARGGSMLRDTNGLLRDMLIGHGLAGPYVPHPQERKPHARGRAEIHAGSSAFVVQVDAAGFAPGEAGPFPALGAPDEIRIVLKRLPGIRGAVVSGGKPVAGAWVKLFQASEEQHVVLVNGFPSRLQPVVQAQTKSADDGRFELPLRDAGRFVIQAGAEGLGEADSETLALEPRTGADGIVLELAALGAIEGRLLLPADETARDRVVGASRGGGRSCSVRTDAEGKFRFEKLSPGAWLLRPLAEDVDPAGEGFEIRYAVGGASELPSTCAVRPGETTRIEIDLRHKAEFVARIELAGLEGGKWTAALDPEGASFSRRTSLSQVAEDALRMSVDQPGDYALRISVWKPEMHGSLRIEERLHLDAGPNVWSLAGPAGQLVIANTLGDKVYPQLRCEGPGGRTLEIDLELAAREEALLETLPAGRWVRVHYDAGRFIEDGAVEVSPVTPARMEWK
jgi:uncharacterized GH25 family protein